MFVSVDYARRETELVMRQQNWQPESPNYQRSKQRLHRYQCPEQRASWLVSQILLSGLLVGAAMVTGIQRAIASPLMLSADPSPGTVTETDADTDSELLEQSPVLRRWQQEIPNVQSEIRHDPAFQTRLRVGYSHFPDADDAAGLHLGIEDVFIERTGLTLSAEYQATFDGEDVAVGAELRYYVLPLGSYVNLAPVVGYQHFNIDDEDMGGVHLGGRLMLALSRTGAADLSLAHGWVAPGSDDEVGISTLSLGYAVSDRLRLSTDLERRGSRQGEDHRLGIGLEWML